MNIAKNLHRRLKLHQCLFVLKYFLDLFNKPLDHLNGQIDKMYCFGILGLILDDVVVKVVYYHI